MNFIIVLILFIIFIIFIFNIKVTTNQPYEKGTYFENSIYHDIIKYIPHTYVFQNIYIKRKNNRLTEIDIVAVDKSGIYVFECKNYSGWIFGRENSHKWYQTFKTGDKYEFYNPIFQNNIHIAALKNVLPKYNNLPYYSIIVFSNECELKNIEISNNENIFIIYNSDIEYLLRNLTAFDSGYSRKKIDIINNIIESLKTTNNKIDTANKHIQDIYESIDKCPYCNGLLVERINKKDNSKFYGCSNYPKCKYTANYKREFI